MSTGQAGSVLPPDIREQMGKQSVRGIGGGAVENATTSHQRDVAMDPDHSVEAKTTETEDPQKTEEVAEVEVRSTCPNESCKLEVEDTWNYCPRCNQDLLLDGVEGRLGIKLSEEDLSNYIFKGQIVREVTVVGKHKATLKSGQAKDLQEIDDYLMNGRWAKDEKGKDRKVSEFYMRQMNAMAQVASCVMKFDGESTGDTFEKRMKWLDWKGSAFVDILSAKVSMYNKAITDYIKKEDTISGS